MIKLECIKENLYTIKYNNKYIHSKFNPIIESERFISRYKYIENKKNIVVYGLGLGYHIETIIKVNNTAKIYIFEANNKIIEICKKIKPYLFKNKNIKIIKYNDKFYNLFKNYLDTCEEFIVHKPSLYTIKDINYKLYNVINNYVIAYESTNELKEQLIQNYSENLKVDYNNIINLVNKFKNKKKKFIITAAGPSLDYELEFLKQSRDSFIIVTVGTALNALMNNNICPDIIVIIDGKKGVANQLKGFENLQIPLCFLSTASRWAVKNYSGPKYMFFNSEDKDDIIIETGKTVAVAAMSIAIHCGAKEIVMLGQDLAYLDGKSHTNTYEDIYGLKDDPIINKNNKFVTGIDSSQLNTTSGYIYFKEQIEKLIETNSNVQFINCSKGAFIRGAKHMEFEQYINDKLNY
ncbi:motility associated factor glycosyltransferase family protein [Clostridium massiliodielmoense]|uniref:motility associated factor glycosyltransferase family protein n=1 Tax=Clostridium massiliodielmoense TaxID=1776385 RepID=UPI0004D6C02F|nr:6-hydroxymethylpterin diphosphokinase MptE-like protein [Clostridium massiliodielmoense]KEH98106.1 hypothetical protein Z962_12890 [Clostridium botulinum C/D str. BKT12695]